VADATGAERQFVVFNLADEMYGVDISAVREIIQYQSPVSVPSAPAAVSGIINLRGTIVGVVDLRKLLGLPQSPISNETRIVVADSEGESLGMVVDAVAEVVRVRSDQIEPAPSVVTSRDSGYVGGIVHVGDKLMIALDLQHTLTAEAVRSAVVHAASASAAVAEPAREVDASPAPTLSDLDIDLLEQTFELVKPRGSEIVDYFYTRLFKQYPGVIPLFDKADMQEQRGKLLGAIALVVSTLRKPEALVPALQQLGIKHVGYGAEPAHYDAVGGILLESLAHVAGSAWTKQIEAAWAAAYTVAANVMRDSAAAYEQQLAA
jgi:chemotaxis signal transduction protein/hemoglobin-like flavoprotein